jgi:hypothetical protein
VHVRRPAGLILGATIAAVLAGCAAAVADKSGKLLTPNERLTVLRRAQVWAATDIPSMDVTRGPDGGFPAGADVECTYKQMTFSGHSPKFGCELGPHDAVKVRYGNDNGEIYAGVAATRLLWALGYGADGLYPVHVVCKQCPPLTDGRVVAGGDERFEVAAIERPFAGHKIEAADTQDGWPWRELDLVDPAVGGAPRAQRDGLKLLAVLLQHTDNKAEQQRLICRGTEHSREELANCADPFMMIHDVGLTFGRANWLNRQSAGSVNFDLWSRTPIWKDRARCVGTLFGSHTGTLHDPVISEAGRAFLSGLLAQLTDQQLHDLFAVARFDRKPHGGAPIDAWVAAFKQKRTEIASIKCPS